MILCTCYDIITSKLRREPKKVFTAFSLVSNFKSLMKINKSESAIKCIDGMKALSALWIVHGHRGFLLIQNEFTDAWWLEHLYFKFASNGALAIVCFFVCSAILVTQSMLRSMES